MAVTTTSLSAWLMLVTGGLFTGVIFTVAVERVNLWRRMPVEQYVVDFQRSVRRVDPLQPIMGTVCAVGAVVFAINSQGRPATLAWIAVGLIAVIMVASFVIAEPMNFRFRRLPEGQAPEGAAEMRTKWRRFHYARCAVALAVLACLAAAITTAAA